jgi:excinuclease ABC subunit C
MNKDIFEQLKTIPHQPGIYRFYNNVGRLLYIGKAKDLFKRVHSYWNNLERLAPDKQIMIRQTVKIETSQVDNETEALILEANLIKQNQPPFNIDLKDNSNFAYLKITLPPKIKIFTTRKLTNDGSFYYGPFTETKNLVFIIRLLKKLFPQIDNRLPFYKKESVSLETWQVMIKKIQNIFQGEYQATLTWLNKEMKTASLTKKYEAAAIWRNRLQAFQSYSEHQKIIIKDKVSMDFLALAANGDQAVIHLIKLRQGKMLFTQNFTLTKTTDLTAGEIIENFLITYYTKSTDLPKQLLVEPASLPANRLVVLQKISPLNQIKKIIIPTRGQKKDILSLATKNASWFLDQQIKTERHSLTWRQTALFNLQKLFNLPILPKRIEGYDISNLFGKTAVGAMTVFSQGLPDKKEYRKFIIKTVAGANDPAMINEIVTRRLRHASWPKPDIIMIDGGPTQLHAAAVALEKKSDFKNVLLISLAKQEEEIYTLYKATPFRLSRHDPALQLLQYLRDEAHRFGITFHQKKRRKKVFGK